MVDLVASNENRILGHPFVEGDQAPVVLRRQGQQVQVCDLLGPCNPAPVDDAGRQEAGVWPELVVGGVYCFFEERGDCRREERVLVG